MGALWLFIGDTHFFSLSFFFFLISQFCLLEIEYFCFVPFPLVIAIDGSVLVLFGLDQLVGYLKNEMLHLKQQFFFINSYFEFRTDKKAHGRIILCN